MFSQSIKIRDRIHQIDSPWIMGIVNLSPESFFTNFSGFSIKKILKSIEEMISLGADIIDIGAVSTQPDLFKISSEIENNRLNNILIEVRKEFKEIILSLDSTNDEIIHKSIDLGIDMINDVSGGNLNNSTFEKIARNKIPYILTFNTNPFENKTTLRKRESIFSDAMHFFSKNIQKIHDLGCHDIILDPGFGFNKEISDNYKLLNHLNDLSVFNKTVLIGVSRKSMLYKLLDSTPDSTLNATSIIHTYSVLNGSSILRVHDVRETNELKKMFAFIGKK